MRTTLLNNVWKFYGIQVVCYGLSYTDSDIIANVSQRS